VARQQLESSRTQRDRLNRRVEQLPIASRLLYRVEHYSSLSSVAIAVMAVVLGLVAAIGLAGFHGTPVAAFQVGSSAVTLMMVLVIQHTQGREQSATQRKLDELLRATPAADDDLMMLEEAPSHVLLDVETGHREQRSEGADEVPGQ
jgi:low affinity Fe/Cu permease